MKTAVNLLLRMPDEVPLPVRRRARRRGRTARAAICLVWAIATTATAADNALADLKRAALAGVEARATLAQQIVDSLFSFAELGLYEYETQRYLTGILEQHGFKVERGVAGIPSAWVATWGSGKPVISLGTDVDALPRLSQKPGITWREPIVADAPGHGEGHNSGMAVVITAAVTVKQIMERAGLPGTLHIWPGVAEEIGAGKAFLVRAGVFADVDAVLYCHVSSRLSTWWGDHPGRSVVSVEYLFEGEEAHAGVAPWEGRSALDAVELMNLGWNYRREHLRPQQRSQYVINNGGDQPNVVPRTASVWYTFRETDYRQVRRLWDIGNNVAQGAALMTDTSVRWRVLGSAWPRYLNRPLAEALHANIQQVGMPAWSAADQAMARAVQTLQGVRPVGLHDTVEAVLSGREWIPDAEKDRGGADDVGDVMWNVPTVLLNLPCNIPGIPIHSWQAAIAMATPIAHKGAVAGAKVFASTMLDLLHQPEMIRAAWAFFENVQTREQKYIPYLGPDDIPPTWLTAPMMEPYRAALRPFHYDPGRYATYLEQLGIAYPAPTPPEAQ
jgi:aminobenzoyl-glutamate utilization protein B